MTSENFESAWIFAHRGQWLSYDQQNTITSFSKAFRNGFSVEADIRERMGRLVISHDVPDYNDSLFELELSESTRFALNVKEDGLLHHLENSRNHIITSSSFVFDGSLPEMYRYKNVGIPHALRLSEYENEIPWKSEYLWIDGFNSDWWIGDPKVLSFVEDYQCIFVSPELHGRDHSRAFDWFADLKINHGLNLSVCTDFPQDLKDHSNG